MTSYLIIYLTTTLLRSTVQGAVSMSDFPWRVWEDSSEEVMPEFRPGRGMGVNQMNVRKNIPGQGNRKCGNSELEESME